MKPSEYISNVNETFEVKHNTTVTDKDECDEEDKKKELEKLESRTVQDLLEVKTVMQKAEVSKKTEDIYNLNKNVETEMELRKAGENLLEEKIDELAKMIENLTRIVQCMNHDKGTENTGNNQSTENVEKSSSQNIAGSMFFVDPNTDCHFKDEKVDESKTGYTQAMTFRPRKCHMLPYCGRYGFGIKITKGRGGHFIAAIQSDSSAEEAGLRRYDRIIEVNNENIENESFEQVASRIEDSGNEITLLVVDKMAYDYYKRLGITVTSRKKEEEPE